MDDDARQVRQFMVTLNNLVGRYSQVIGAAIVARILLEESKLQLAIVEMQKFRDITKQ